MPAANVQDFGSSGGGGDFSLLGGGNEPSIDLTQQQQANYNVQRAQDYVAAGGNPADIASSFGYTSPLGAQMTGGSAGGSSGLLGGGYYGGGYGAATYKAYAPYDEGGGHTKWDEFVQQMQLEQAKLAQDKALQEEQLAQQKLLQEEQIAEQKYAANQQAVTDFDKQLNDMKGPADPYGYLFASRGLAAPQGYQPTALPLSDAVSQAYKNQGVDLAQAQSQISGSSGPSFISGYLGSMPTSLQQGPMGFQNTPQFGATPPGSQQQQDLMKSATTQNSQQPTKMAKGGTVPGFAPGQDSVPAQLSPGEGVLTPEAVQMLGGPQAIARFNQQAVQHFASGGIVQPTVTQPPPIQDAFRQFGSWLNQANRPDIQQGISEGRDADVLGQFLKEAYGGNSPQAATQFMQALEQPGRTGTTPGQFQSWLTQANRPDLQQGVNEGRLSDVFGQYLRETNNLSPAGYSQLFSGLGQTPPPVVPTYDIAGQQVGAGSFENAPPQGYTMITPGVATAPPTPTATLAGSASQTGLAGTASPTPNMFGSGWQNGVEQWFQNALGQSPQPLPAVNYGAGQPASGPIGPLPRSTPGQPMPASQLGSRPIGPLPRSTPGQPVPGAGPGKEMPVPGLPPLGGASSQGVTSPLGAPSMDNPNAPLLTGGVLNPVGPAGGPPMNLNDLDPYTRSLVDQYGRPQIPSLQAWNQMPQSGQQAFQNYVEKVAGGNFQDLLDQQQQMAPQGVNPGDLSFS
jgi:hypothetical protein